MSANFLQLPKAQRETIASWEWYEDHETGLGDRFKEQVRLKIKAISANSLYYPKKGKYHEALSEDFPFFIIFQYKKQSNLVLIVGFSY